MKKYSKFLLPAVILVLVVVSVLVNRKQDTQLTDLTDVVVSDAGQFCFLYEQEGVSYENEEGNLVQLFDRESVQFSELNDVTVTGTHDILPAEKDSNRATFFGVQRDGYINVIATANAKGETWQEQRLYQIDGDKLFVGYQKVYLPQYQEENGIYFYEDLNNIAFDTDEFFLNKVDCSNIKN
jgi:hypothetical protein